MYIRLYKYIFFVTPKTVCFTLLPVSHIITYFHPLGVVSRWRDPQPQVGVRLNLSNQRRVSHAKCDILSINGNE